MRTRQSLEAAIQAAAREVVAKAPPLSAEQLARIALLLKVGER